MNSFVKFKDYLRIKRKYVQSTMSDCQRKLEEINADIDAYVDDRNVAIRFLNFLVPQKFEDERKVKLWQERESLNSKLRELNDSKIRFDNLIRSFDNEKAINCQTSPSSLFLIVMGSYKSKIIDIQDVSKIMGSFLYLIAAKGGDQKFKCFYNQYGDFVMSESDIRDAWEFFLATFSRGNDYSDVVNKIGSLYDSFKENYREPDNVISVDEGKGINFESLAKLRQYYKNCTLIKMPTDLEEFEQLLDDCMIDIAERRYIYSLIQSKCQNQQLESMDTVSKGTSEVSIIFLNDLQGISYIKEDIDELDNGLKRQTIGLLSKIRPDYKRKFRRVFNKLDASICFYEVYNSDTHVIFLPLNNDTYLVLGAAVRDKDYDKITNRYFRAKSLGHINYIEEMLGEDNATLLIENSPCLTRLFSEK